jgi:hypothetical protein
MTDETAKKNQHQVAVILWAALIMSAFMYLGLTFILPRNADRTEQFANQVNGQSVESSFGSSAGESPSSGEDGASIDGPAGGAANPILGILYPFGLAMALAGLAVGHARSLWKDAGAAKTLNILSLAFCESCALMGLLIYLLGSGDATEPRSMMIMAIVCMAMLFPTPKRMRLA